MKKQFVWIFAVCWLVACQTPTAVSPTTSPTAIPIPSPTATSTLLPTATAAPTQPPPTATALPTIAPTAVPTIPPTPTATPAIEGLIGPTDFPANVNPLTGLVVSDPAVLAKRPLAIKISNAPPFVRPQAGLGSADLVFEHYAEGGATRFTAVFYTHDVEKVGSIRSARLIDLEIPVMYDAAFAYSGSAGRVREQIRASSFYERVVSPDFAHGGFERIPDGDKPATHTLFTNTYNLRFILDERGQNVPPTFANGMAFRAEPLQAGTPAGRVEIAYTGTNATWVWINGRYSRWTDGEPHLDANSGEQLRFDNIVVVAAEHVNTDIVEDTNGEPSIQIQIWGEGSASVFRNGVRINGRWHRADPSHMLTFTDLNGNILPLTPGTTFFQLVPLGFDRLFVAEK